MLLLCRVLLLLPFPLALTSTRLHLGSSFNYDFKKRAIEEWCPNLGLDKLCTHPKSYISNYKYTDAFYECVMPMAVFIYSFCEYDITKADV